VSRESRLSIRRFAKAALSAAGNFRADASHSLKLSAILPPVVLKIIPPCMRRFKMSSSECREHINCPDI
jgi:hypothetical protein